MILYLVFQERYKNSQSKYENQYLNTQILTPRLMRVMITIHFHETLIYVMYAIVLSEENKVSIHLGM